MYKSQRRENPGKVELDLVSRFNEPNQADEEGSHGCEYYEYAHGKPDVFAEDELPTLHRLGEDNVNCPSLQLFVDQVGASKNCDDSTDDGNDRKSHIFYDADVLTDREGTQKDTHHRNQASKNEECIEDPVSDGFSESVEGDCLNGAVCIDHCSVTSNTLAARDHHDIASELHCRLSDSPEPLSCRGRVCSRKNSSRSL